MLFPAKTGRTLLRPMAIVVILAMLAASLVLPTAAEGEKQLTHVTEMPERFIDAESVEFEDYDDAAGEYYNYIDVDEDTWFDYVYLKKEADLPFLTVSFVVGSSGMYEFLFDIMAYETAIPRTALLQVDDGEKFYCSVTHNDHHLVHEYFTGFTAELASGLHTMTIYLGDDFDDVTVKSIFFDRFYFIRTGDPENLPIETLPEETTEPPTEAPTEVPTEAPTEAPTETPTEVPTQAPATTPTDDSKGGCGATIGGMTGLFLWIGAAFVSLRKRP